MDARELKQTIFEADNIDDAKTKADELMKKLDKSYKFEGLKAERDFTISLFIK